MAASATPAMGGVTSPGTKFIYAPSGASTWHYSCFGYQGTFGGGTRIAKVDWQENGSVDECFGIAPSRTIWHAWRHSGGWKEMPNNGRADDMDFAYFDEDNNRQITVRVYTRSDSYPGELWGSSYKRSSWQPWVKLLS